jgi:hypothetical protein
MRSAAKLTAFALAIALGAEAAARMFIPLDALVYRDSDDPALSFELLPGAHGEKNTVPVEISAQGLRDDLVPEEKAPGERRVVVVGGHETFGIGVESRDTFVRRLQEGLIDPGEGSARTINLSMYSYHLGQKVELACRRLSSLKPEFVVLQVSEEDAGGPYPPLLEVPRLKNWIREHSVLLRWASEKYYLRKRADPPGRATDDYAKTRAQLRRFKGCVDAVGARAAVVLVPEISKPRPASPSDLRLGLEAEAKELGLPMVDAAPALEALPPKERAVFEADRFLSPAAHRLLADELRRRLRPLLKKRPAPSPARRRLTAAAESAGEWFDFGVAGRGTDPYRFMLATAPVRADRREKLGAVTHADGSARVQAVSAGESPLYHRLISSFGAETGVPVLLNTSFNLKGEPIVESPDDAISTFRASGMDALVLGSFLVPKRPAGMPSRRSTWAASATPSDGWGWSGSCSRSCGASGCGG